jgi:hypothetical protein
LRIPLASGFWPPEVWAEAPLVKTLPAMPKVDSTAPKRVAKVLRVTLEFIKSSCIALLILL